MKKIIFLIIIYALQQGTYAQENVKLPDTLMVGADLSEVVVSANNFTEKKKNVAQKIDVINSKAIAMSNSQNTGDLLINTGKIFVQKSQQGGSSPVLRGFEASRILLVIDGVRMNNAIYRSGHLQNVITVDQNSLSRAEIMYGPSSTIYGSDALGGIVHLITKSPVLSGSKNFLTTGSGFARYSSVNNENTIHADASIGGKKFAWFQGYNFSNFGDMKMGNKYPEKYPDFGRRTQYIGQVNGVDSLMTNPDDRVQKFSGYKQWDITQKLLFQQSDKISHSLNLQLSNTNNVPRYDRLQDVKDFGGNIGKKLRFAEWYYGPQKRILAAYQVSFLKSGFFDEFKANVNYQDIEESRQTREYRRNDRFDSQVEKVKVIGATINGRKLMGNNELVIGTDMQLNDVKSVANRTNQVTGVITKIISRFPDGDNKMNYAGLYAQHVYKFTNKKLILNDGLRLQSVRLKSNVLDNSFLHLPDTAVTQNNIAVTGNIGLVYLPSSNTIIKVSLASGFRAPNVDDLSKVFESSTSLKQVVIPNANLKPEYTYNVDLSLTQIIAKRVTVEVTGFYTMFRNAIVKAPFTLNGKDSILFNGTMSQVLASQNVNKAKIYGASVVLSAAITNSLTFNSTVSYTKGSFQTDNSKTSTVYEKLSDGTYKLVNKAVSSKPLDHIPPLIGKTGIVFVHKKFNTEIYCLYNGWKHLDNYNADGEDNAQYATADGMPSWFTANWKANVNVTNKVQLQVGIENILDRNYRYFASGFSAGGRNYLAALRVNW